jgi:hypothetical protein
MSDPTLRDAIDSAVAEVEKTEATAPEPVKAELIPAEPAPVSKKAEVQEPKGQAEPKAAPAEPAEPTATADKAPQSWKVPVRAHWEKIPPEARAEIMRRERDVTKALSESGQARQLASQLSEAARPFEARMRTLGVSAVQFAGQLFQADYLLSTAPPTQRAQFVAKLVKDYEVDIRELDAALAGQPGANPVQAEVDRLLAERLAPFQTFVQQQQAQAEQQRQVSRQEAQTTIEQMELDSTNFPHFDQVREDMADIIEISSRRGVYIEPKQAYSKAVLMNPELASQAAAQYQADTQRQQAQASTARAQKALGASASVSGTPSGVPGNSGSTGTLRETIEAAFSRATGR